MTYCDTSFLASLYLKEDANHKAAAKVAAKFKEPIPFTLLIELELTNALQRAAQTEMIATAELTEILSQIERDIREGFLERTPVNQADQYKLALDLSGRRAKLLCRSLDILHVSAALLIKASAFATFDVRQRSLAIAEGIRGLAK